MATLDDIDVTLRASGLRACVGCDTVMADAECDRCARCALCDGLVCGFCVSNGLCLSLNGNRVCVGCVDAPGFTEVWMRLR
jgi:hypothetical protein